MAYPVSPYIEERNGDLYAAVSGVSLDFVVIRFQEGADPDKGNRRIHHGRRT